MVTPLYLPALVLLCVEGVGRRKGRLWAGAYALFDSVSYPAVGAAAISWGTCGSCLRPQVQE
jgi:hypothetical protein